MQRNSKKRIKIFVVLSAFFACFLSAPYTAYATTVNLTTVRSQINAAAQMHVIAFNVKKCIMNHGYSAGYTTDSDYLAYMSSSVVLSGDIFDYTSDTKYNTGPWLENQVQGQRSYNSDGYIYCNNDDSTLFKLFAQKLGLSVLQVVCNKDNTGLPGLYSKVDYWTDNNYYSHAYASSKNCDVADMGRWDEYHTIVDTNYDVNVGGGHTEPIGRRGLKYLEDLYNSFDNRNPYLVPWSQLDYFDKVDGYYLYLNDFKSACSKTEKDANYATSHSTFTIKTVNDKGEIVDAYYDLSLNGNSTNTNTSTGASFVANGPTTCGGLVEKINTYASLYQQKILDEIKKQCKDALSSEIDTQIADLESHLNDENLTEDSKTAAEAKIAELQAIKTSAEYTKSTSGGGLECIEVEGITLQYQEDPNEQPPSETENTDPVQQDACYTAAESLGWILCPVIKSMSEALDAAYEKYIEPFLQVDSEFFADNSAVEQGWGMFRDLANIAFAIVLLIVLFSQLTGLGIDNYGIKKILPKLIVAAILINMSYIICQIAADLSNILGMSLKDLFQGMADNVYGVASGSHTDPTANLLTTLLGLGGGVYAFAAIMDGGGWAILFGIIAALFAAIIAVIFLFILLAVRKVGIVVLIIVSPIAFICYMLPNTQGLFKKWFGAFKGLLVMFPICGALIGAGYLGSRVIVTSTIGGSLSSMVGTIMLVVPYFFVPTLLKNSLAGLGSVGAKISGLGNRLSSGTRKGINNAAGRSSLVRNQQANIAERRAMRDDQRQQERVNKTLSRLKKRQEAGKGDYGVAITSNQKQRSQERLNNRIASLTTTKQANDMKNARNARIATSKNYAQAMEAQQEAKQKNDDINDLSTLIANDGFEYDNGVKVNHNNLSDLEAAFAYETSRTGADYDDNRVLALQRALAAQSDKGVEKISNVFNRGQMSAEAVKTVSGEIASNAGSYKKQSRSLFSIAGSISSGDGKVGYGQGVIERAQQSGQFINSIKPSELTSMSDSEFDAFAGLARSSNDNVRNAAARIAQGALSDPSVTSNLNRDQIGKLETLAAAGEIASAQVVNGAQNVQNAGVVNGGDPSDIQIDHADQATGRPYNLTGPNTAANDAHATAQAQAANSTVSGSTTPVSQPTHQPTPQTHNPAPVNNPQPQIVNPAQATQTDSGIVLTHGDLSMDQIQNLASAPSNAFQRESQIVIQNTPQNNPSNTTPTPSQAPNNNQNNNTPDIEL